MVLTAADRPLLVIREFVMVLPRAVDALWQSDGWSPTSPRAMRQLGEVALDELVLTGMSVMGGRVAASPRPMESYVPAAEELSALGVAARTRTRHRCRSERSAVGASGGSPTRQ